MSISAHRDDPQLETLARELFALFPVCLRCSQPIERFEDAEVLVLVHRLAHRGACAAAPAPEPKA